MLTLATRTEELEHSSSYRVSRKNTADDNLPKLQHKIRIKSKKDEAYFKNYDYGEGKYTEAIPDSYFF